MNSAQHVLDPLRSAALTLHALDAPDRQWLLEGLSQRQREMLLPLLEELQVLGIPGDPALLQELHPHGDTPAQSPAWPETLDPGEVATLARVLADEPVGLTRSLLAIRAWRWTPQLIAALDERRRQELEAQPAARAPAPVLQSAILQALKMRCESLPPEAPRIPQGRWQRARSRLVRWGGRS